MVVNTGGRIKSPGAWLGFLLVGAVMVVWNLVTLCLEVRFNAEAVPVVAKVDSTSDLPASNHGTIQYANYSFIVNGKTFSGDAQSAASRKPTVRIEYRRSAPEDNRLAGSRNYGWSLGFIGAGLLLTVIGCYLFKQTNDLVET